MIEFVSSFSEEGYELYGKRFLESFTKHWDWPLTIYYEDVQPDFEHDQVTFKNLFEVKGCKQYLAATSTFPIFKGLIDVKRDYRFDTYRFARKMFAQADAADGKDGQLWWIDADTEILSPLPESLLEDALEGVLMAFMGRPGWHSCASLVGWDLAHPYSQSFWMAYFNLHTTGQIFVLPEWHDSYVLDVLRKESGIPARNMAEHIEMDNGPVNVFDLVLDGYARHFKGNKKFRDFPAAVNE
jgi:hypothetical protein